MTGTPIASNIPSSVGGAIASFRVSPALPGGLDLDSTTGVISGTPNVVSPATVHTVTASNAAGDTSAMVSITVNAAPPANLSYATPVNYVTGTTIAPNQPTSTGGPIDSYAISPMLPTGLNFNTSTGIISGTPMATSAAADYTVTATNTAGNANATVNITVSASLQPPSNLSYTSPVSYATGSAITANAPSVSGGAVATWAISPALPAGLVFNTGTGVINGTPTAVTSAADYTVTATNAAGSTNTKVNITVTLGAPTSLSYTNTPNIGYVTGGFFATMSPMVKGGAVSSWSINLSLPNGISFNTSTGVISGSPSSISGQTSYIVTAGNSTGSTTATIVITVLT
ncbi:MAG: putative Ig domain-containing protein [Planctomycetota bacterium]